MLVLGWVLAAACGGRPHAPDPRPDPAVPQSSRPLHGGQRLFVGVASVCVLGASDGVPTCYGDLEIMIGERSHHRRLPELGIVDVLAPDERGGCTLVGQRLRCFGRNASDIAAARGDEEPPSPLGLIEVANDAVSVELFGFFGCFRRTDRSAWCWRTALAESESEATVRLGEIREFVRDVDDIVIDLELRCVIARNGEVRCAGADRYRAGHYDEMEELTPVAGVGPSVSLVVTSDSTCALQADAAVVCWGGLVPAEVMEADRDVRADYDDSFADALVRWVVPGLRATSLVGYDCAACAISREGEVICWGDVASLLGTSQVADGHLVHVERLRGATEIGVGGPGLCGLVGGELRCLGDWFGAAQQDPEAFPPIPGSAGAP